MTVQLATEAVWRWWEDDGGHRIQRVRSSVVGVCVWGGSGHPCVDCTHEASRVKVARAPHARSATLRAVPQPSAPLSDHHHCHLTHTALSTIHQPAKPRPLNSMISQNGLSPAHYTPMPTFLSVRVCSSGTCRQWSRQTPPCVYPSRGHVSAQQDHHCQQKVESPSTLVHMTSRLF